MSYAIQNRVDVIASAGSAVENGTMLLTALRTAVSGDEVRLGRGTFDVGTTQIFVPAGVLVKGAGKGLTVILSASNANPAQVGDAGYFNGLYMANGSTLADLSLYFIPTTAVLGFGLTTETSASATLKNVSIIGDSDCIYTGISTIGGVKVGTNSSITATGCDFYSMLDTFNTDATGVTFTAVDCTFTVGEAARTVVGSGAYGYVATSGLIRCIEVSSSLYNTVKCYGCRFTLEKAVTDTPQGFCVEVKDSTSTVELHNCIFNTTSNGGSAIDLKVAGGAVILTDRCYGSGPNGALVLAASSAALVPSITSAEIVDPSSLGSESLTNGTFTGNATSWTAAGDIAYGTNNCVYTDSTHSGSLTQAKADLATALIGNAWYKLTYKITAAAGSPAATITTGILDAAKVIDVATNCNLRVVYFKTKAVPGDFVLAFTSVAGDTFTIDSISLKQITGGNIVAAGTISATGGLAVPLAANDAGAAALGIAVGGLYAVTGTGVVMRRAT